jgi:hypothetical protein
MRAYLALGDSISIDDYTGVRGGGAASQLARRLGVELVDLTLDGNTTHGVLADLARAPATADVVTLTAGGNDLLGGELPRAILRRLHQIAQRIRPLGARAIINTIYDPSDGDNDLGRRELGLSRLATIELAKAAEHCQSRHQASGRRARLPPGGSRAAVPRTRPRVKRPMVRPSDRAEPRRRERNRRALARPADIIELERTRAAST